MAECPRPITRGMRLVRLPQSDEEQGIATPCPMSQGASVLEHVTLDLRWFTIDDWPWAARIDWDVVLFPRLAAFERLCQAWWQVVRMRWDRRLQRR